MFLQVRIKIKNKNRNKKNFLQIRTREILTPNDHNFILFFALLADLYSISCNKNKKHNINVFQKIFIFRQSYRKDSIKYAFQLYPDLLKSENLLVFKREVFSTIELNSSSVQSSQEDIKDSAKGKFIILLFASSPHSAQKCFEFGNLTLGCS